MSSSRHGLSIGIESAGSEFYAGDAKYFESLDVALAWLDK